MMAHRLVRNAGVSLLVGGLLGGCVVIVAAIFAVLAPVLATHHGSGPDFSLRLLIVACLLLLSFALAALVVGWSMIRLRSWARVGGIVVCLLMLALFAAAFLLGLASGSPSDQPASGSGLVHDLFEPKNGGLFFFVLLFPIWMAKGVPVALLVLACGAAAWPLSIIALLRSEAGRQVFAADPAATAPGSSLPPAGK